MEKNAIHCLEDVRRSVTYHPSVWGEHFLAYASETMENSSQEDEQIQKVKEEVRQLLAVTPHHSLHKLELIDAIQRLGVAYHFHDEIDKFLKNIHQHDYKDNEDSNLHVVALRFLLLRQQGYAASPEVFNKFKDDEGNFDESLMENVEGLLSLYEAAQYTVHGEDILDEALQFSASRLRSLSLSNLNNISAKVKQAFEIPIHKTLNRLYAVKFMSLYEQDESHNPLLLYFAKLDFSFLQKMHQKELAHITMWWKGLDMGNKLPFARDRMVECYMWLLAMYFEPQFQDGRIILSKILQLISIMDDIYDVYGSLEELRLFTDVIQRWDRSVLEQLPPYMKITFDAILNVFVEMEELVTSYDKKHWTNFAIEEMKKLSRAYHQESEWTYEGYNPSIEEYIKVGVPSSSYMLLSTACLIGMRNLVVDTDFEWVSSEPSIVCASSLIGRLMNDIAGYGNEKKFCGVDCYMKERGLTKEEAFEDIEKELSKAWKEMNEEWIHPTKVSKEILMPIVNLARISYLAYRDGDGYTNSQTHMKEAIQLVLVQSMPI